MPVESGLVGFAAKPVFTPFESDMSLDDSQIMRQVQEGRFEPFDELVRRYRGALLRVAESKLGNAAWAEDAVQETFIAVFAARDTFNPSFAFRTWLWTILLNVCRRQLKRRARQPQSVPTHIAFASSSKLTSEEPVHHESGLTRAILNERDAKLREVLLKLPDAQADALRLRFFGGLQFQEIADAMDCSLNGAKMQVKKGLLALAETLRHEEGDER